MKVDKTTLLPLILGILFVILYGFFNLQNNNSVEFLTAVERFKKATEPQIEIDLEDSSGTLIYSYKNKIEFEDNLHLVNLLNESRILNGNHQGSYCIRAAFSETQFKGCFSDSQRLENLPLSLLIKIISIKSIKN